MSEETPPAPSIEALSQRSQNLLVELAQKQLKETEFEGELLANTLTSLKSDLDGQPLALLEETLDWVRDAGLYALSVPLLEEAWSAELPLDFLGRVAQDWVGSVLFGLGDKKGAQEVAQHLETRAKELGPSFCGDLCDVWLEWGLFEEAEPLAQFVHTKQPGEIGALFHLLICAKMRLAWEEAEGYLAEIDKRRQLNTANKPDPAIEWNRGIIAVARKDWSIARRAWQGVGFQFPEESGQESEDYATAGELSPVRLKISQQDIEASQGRLPQSEVIWGRRIGPARVELTALPYYHPHYRCGDVLLIDGVQEGKVDYNGQSYPVSPALGKWTASPGETLRLYGIQTKLKEVINLDQFVQVMSEKGWTIVQWTRLIRLQTPQGEPMIQLAFYLPPNKDIHEIADALNVLIQEELSPKLYSLRYAELIGEEREEHQKVLKMMGLQAYFIN